ncbi:MAG: hypothetical protein J0H99_15225, partial [Rhodospirillales bacterium]|nr:hypothetical protein [Rhodospirillales bacterium]
IKAELESGLAMHTGSTRWFRHWTRRLVYTEGVQYLAEKANAYWLIDLVASWCPHPSLRSEEFVVWKLSVKPDRTAIAVADDGNGRELARQDISLTDFPLDEISLYLIDNTLLLPSEY